MPTPHIVLFDGNDRNNLLPLTATRAIADLRIGILTLKEKWEQHFKTTVDVLTIDYLQHKYSYQQKENTVFINTKFLPHPGLIEDIEELGRNEMLKCRTILVALKTNQPINSLEDIYKMEASGNYGHKQISTDESTYMLTYPWDIFTFNGHEIKNDIELLKLKPNPEKLSKTNTILGGEIYVGDEVSCECSVLNAQNGPIYLGSDSEIMEGCTIRGSFALGEHATLKMQTKIYGDTTIGPFCKVGGEVSNSVIFGYSNKGHDGFLGNSVIGEWCNLGADTNNSNLKNNYGKIKAWNYPLKNYVDTGLQFCGLIMGDHAKSSINTMFNTGTVMGVCANVFSGGFPPKFIPDFSWGENAVFDLEKAYEVAQRVMARRDIDLSVLEANILKHIFEETKEFRTPK